MWGLIITLLRFSAILSFKNTFIKRQAKLTSCFLLIVSVTHGMATILEALLICRPISAAWDQNTRGSCGNDVAAYIVFEISGLIIDLAIGTWLIPLDLRLQMNKRRKIQVILIRSTGLL